MRDVALVTGAHGGLGRALTASLAQAGVDVVGVCRPGQGGESDHPTISVDLLDPDAARRVHAAVRARHERVTILVNNAGAHANSVRSAGRGARPGGDEASPAGEDALFDLHWRAPRDLVAAFEEDLRQAGGAVVNVSSTNAFRLDPGIAAYAASKLALCHLTRLQARQLAPDVRVNAVLPGLIDAGMTRRAPPSVVSSLLEDVPFARLGTPEEVASVVMFLVGRDASYVTGQLLEVDGGQMLGGRAL